MLPLGLAMVAVVQSGAALGSCAQELNETSRWLAKAAEAVDRNSVMLVPGLALVAAAGEPLSLSSGVVPVHLTSDATWIQSTPSAAIAKAKVPLKNALDLARQVGKAEVVLLIDGGVEWRRVRGILNDAVELGVSRVAVVFADVQFTALRPTGPTSIDRELEEIRETSDVAQKSEKLSAVFKKVVAACPSLASTLSGSWGPELKRLAKALPSCPCGLDAGALRRLLWSAAVVTEPQVAVTVELSPKGEPVRASSAARWENAHPVLLEAAKQKKPVRLEIEKGK
jgi:hypothetical protein